MKNALTPIVFSTHRLRKSAEGMEPAEAARVRQALDTVNEEVEGLRRLAASFSELARLPVPEMERFDLKAMVEAAVQSAPEQAGRLTVELPRDEVPVQGDRTLLRQAVANVVKNAIEATGETDRIWIRLETGDREVRLVVEDAGAGWPEEQRERSLDPYVTTKETGTGLGLSLVQRTLLQHGGSVELGDRPGGGARVTLILPRESMGTAEQEGS
jgi:two-component system nitrogen regulation sensor histidine kinase NtrY